MQNDMHYSTVLMKRKTNERIERDVPKKKRSKVLKFLAFKAPLYHMILF